jgi:hypothetical protein
LAIMKQVISLCSRPSGLSDFLGSEFCFQSVFRWVLRRSIQILEVKKHITESKLI